MDTLMKTSEKINKVVSYIGAVCFVVLILPVCYRCSADLC